MNKRTKNMLKGCQQEQSIEELTYLEQMKSNAKSICDKNHENQKMVPVQFYMTNTMKRRLKMYCLSNDTKMTDVLNKIVSDFLTSKGF